MVHKKACIFNEPLYNKDMRKSSRIIWVAILLVVLVLAPQGAKAQTGGERKFPGGIILSGEWLAAWEASPDPYAEYGIPITRVMTSSSGDTVLYTQQARFRQTPDGIVRDPLGSMLYTPGKPANFSLNTGACKVYGHTGFHICYAFLQVYASHGAMLGAPLADPEEMNGRIVQAFEYGWLEWRPENPPDQRVIFIDLGRIAFDLWEKASLQQVPRDNAPVTSGEVDSLTAFTFVEKALLPAGTSQNVFVIASTADHTPLEGVAVQVVLKYANGREQGFISAVTDADGIARFNLPVQGKGDGQLVEVKASLSYGTLTAHASTSFRLWR